MLAENDWISSEKHLFGQPNTAYDFKTNNPKEAGQRLKRLEETKDKLERNVNRRAMNMLSEAEERVWPLTSLVTVLLKMLLQKCIKLEIMGFISRSYCTPESKERNEKRFILFCMLRLSGQVNVLKRKKAIIYIFFLLLLSLKGYILYIQYLSKRFGVRFFVDVFFKRSLLSSTKLHLFNHK